MTSTRPYPVALVAAFALFLVVLDNTIVNVAVVPIAHALRSDLSAVQWVVTAYFLAQAAVIPVAGYLSERFGLKRVFLIALASFIGGSALCGASSSVAQLVIARILQGIGGGAMYPLALATAFGVFKGPDRAKASSIITIPVLIAPAFGPTVGGYLTEHFGWASIFLVNVPVGLTALALAFRVFPPDPVHPPLKVRPRFDLIGLMLCIAGVFTLAYGFTLVGMGRPETADFLHPRGLPHGWTSSAVWACLGSGATLLTIFAWYELKISVEPVLDLRLFTRREFTIASLVAWLNGGLFFSSMFLLPIFLQQIRLHPLSPFEVGLALMPQGIGAAMAVALTGYLYHRVGVRILASVGTILLAFSSWKIGHSTLATDGYSLLPWIFIRGLGFGSTFQLMQAKAMENLDRLELPKASSLFNVTRQLASSVGLAVMLSLLTQFTVSNTITLRDAGWIDTTARLQALAGTAAFNQVFDLIAVVSILVLALTLALPGRAPVAHAATSRSEPKVRLKEPEPVA